MSSREIVYKFVSREPKSRSTPFKFRIKQVFFQNATSRSASQNYAAVTPYLEKEKVHGTEEVNIEEKMLLKPRWFGAFPWYPYNSQPHSQLKVTDTQEPWKKQMMRRVLEKFKAEWDAEEDRKRERKGDVKEEMYKTFKKRKAYVTEAQPSKKP
ncbi:hypothetical protein Tco_0543047 [Tanacetum coccineum]